MATIEGLFNFDEKLLARQVAKDNYGAALGRATAGPWGPMVMGVNKIGNAIFNNDDKILREQTLANTALKETMDALDGDTSDMTKLYNMLGEKLIEKGASAETLMKLKSVQSTQANEAATTEANIAYKDTAQQMQVDQNAMNNAWKAKTFSQKEHSNFEKATKDPNSVYAQQLKSSLNKLTQGANIDDNGYKQTLQLFSNLVSTYIDEGMSTTKAMTAAENEISNSYTYSKDTQWFGDNSSIQQNSNDGMTDPSTEDQEFLDMIEAKRTK